MWPGGRCIRGYRSRRGCSTIAGGCRRVDGADATHRRRVVRGDHELGDDVPFAHPGHLAFPRCNRIRRRHDLDRKRDAGNEAPYRRHQAKPKGVRTLLRDPVELREIVVVERYGHHIGERVVGRVDLILLGLARFNFDDLFNGAVRYRRRLIRRFLRKGRRGHREKQGCCATAEEAESR